LIVDGTFDDCQKYGENSFSDEELIQNICNVTSAIVLMLLVASKMFYFCLATKRWKSKGKGNYYFSVPKWQFGKYLWQVIMAQRLGMPCQSFYASTM